MSVDSIKKAIKDLPKAEYMALRDWITERDQKNWGNQIEQDSASGKLNFLKEEAIDSISERSLEGL